jgi:hypothetical protein
VYNINIPNMDTSGSSSSSFDDFPADKIGCKLKSGRTYKEPQVGQRFKHERDPKIRCVILRIYGVNGETVVRYRKYYEGVPYAASREKYLYDFVVHSNYIRE